MLQLNDDNYYSPEANKEYMSVSQYKDFRECEAAALAKINGTYETPKNDAMLLGSYVHAWNEGIIEKFKAENPQIFSSRGASKGELKTEFKNAEQMIKVLEQDKFCMYVLQGDKEQIFIAELGGVMWKSKLDVVNHDKKRFVDLKTTKDFKKVWNEKQEKYTSFVEAYGYITQMAVYREILKQATGETYEPYMVAVTKETLPDKAIISFDDENLNIALEEVMMNIGRIQSIKNGEEEAVGCGKCDYCKRMKRVNKIIHYSEL